MPEASRLFPTQPPQEPEIFLALFMSKETEGLTSAELLADVTGPESRRLGKQTQCPGLSLPGHRGQMEACVCVACLQDGLYATIPLEMVPTSRGWVLFFKEEGS